MDLGVHYFQTPNEVLTQKVDQDLAMACFEDKEYIYIILSMSNQPFSNIQPTLQLQHFRSSSVKWCCERHGEFEL